MTYLFLILGIVLLIVLISVWKFNAFLAFILVAFLVGMLNKMEIIPLVNSIQKGIGNILGSLLIIICFGAMQGKLIVSSGAAQRITDHLIQLFGVRYLQWALFITGLIVGIPLFYGVGFVLLAPLVINLSVQKKLPAVWLGFPMFAILSAMHGFLPPHPSPVAITQMLSGDLGQTLLKGSIVALGSVAVAGIFYSRFVKNITNKPMTAFISERKPEDQLPKLSYSYIACFLPILLIGAAAIAKSLAGTEPSSFHKFILICGEPAVAMTISLLFTILVLSRNAHIPVVKSMKETEKAVSDITSVLLVIAGAGAFNQVLSDCGLTEQLTKDLSTLHTSPLLLGFLVAMIIRVATGSATIAGLTAVGIIKPLFLQAHIPTELMVLSIGSGSLMLSHVNDSGFWLFKEYFNLSLKQTFKSWTVMESLLGLTGLIIVLILKALFY
ncbi:MULTISPECIES: GntP family permease [Chitinophagaceae]